MVEVVKGMIKHFHQVVVRRGERDFVIMMRSSEVVEMIVIQDRLIECIVRKIQKILKKI